MTVAVSARNPIRTSAQYVGPMIPVDLVSFIFTLIEIAFSFFADFHPRLYPLLYLSYLESWERERESQYFSCNVVCSTSELLISFL